MAKRKMSVSEIASVVESEGLGYALEHGVTFKNIKDEDLSDMWERAADLLSEIRDYIEENSDDVDDDGDDDDEAPEEDEY